MSSRCPLSLPCDFILLHQHFRPQSWLQDVVEAARSAQAARAAQAVMEVDPQLKTDALPRSGSEIQNFS